MFPVGGVDLEQQLEDRRRQYMREAMERCGQVQTRAAELLGMTFRSFRYFAKKYGLTGKDMLQQTADRDDRDKPEVSAAMAGEVK